MTGFLRQRDWLLVRFAMIVILGGVAATVRGHEPVEQVDVTVRLAGAETVAHSPFFWESDHVRVIGAVEWNRDRQAMEVVGTYASDEPFDPASHLAYQVYGEGDELLAADGVRFPWSETLANGWRRAHFRIGLPRWRDDPDRVSWRIQFNPLVEGEFWYRDVHPDWNYAVLAITGAPRRARYATVWTWIPWFLPAPGRSRVPVWITEVHGAATGSAPYVGALDVVEKDSGARIESWRQPPETDRSFWQWQPVDFAAERAMTQVRIRPGMMWPAVKWYRGFPEKDYETVWLVPVLPYAAGVVLLTLAMGCGWARVGRMNSPLARRAARGLVVATAGCLIMNVVISGFWFVVAVLALAALAAALPRAMPGLRSYLVVWVFAAFVELYWGHYFPSHSIRGRAIIYSIALAGVLLGPLLWVRCRWLRRMLAGGLLLSWPAVTLMMDVYDSFFSDYPSILSLRYAAQTAELGDSISVLLSPHHFVPFVVLAGIVVILGLNSRLSDQRKTQAENA